MLISLTLKKLQTRPCSSLPVGMKQTIILLCISRLRTYQTKLVDLDVRNPDIRIVEGIQHGVLISASSEVTEKHEDGAEGEGQG